MKPITHFRAPMLALLVLLTGLMLVPVTEAQQPRRDRDGMPAVPQGGPGRVGALVERLRLTLPVDPVVVVVPSGDAYIDAIARWSTDHRFPVLIDDGTPEAKANIARFVRAFEPEEVLLWPGGRKHEGSVRSRLEKGLYRSWGADSPGGLREVWDAMKHRPPGIVVTAEDDPAWPAALALAAGRGQPIVWVDRKRGRVGGVDKQEYTEKFEKQVLEGIKGVGYRWNKVGDDIDAISICMNMPNRIYVKGSSKDILAITDKIGRHDNGEVFAWTGLIFGNEAETAYRAMSAIFLQPGEAWLFNGYGTEPPYDGYSMYPAETAFKRVRISAESFHPPRNSVSDWRRATRRPIDPGYIHVNAAGHRDWFDLHPGKGYTADIPFMHKPAMVYFTHSFSAQDVDDKGSIARRWLDNGAYAYVGAVDEPYLAAFTPPAYVTQGLLTPLPWAVMARPNSDKPWKINVLGDPLITIGPVAKRTERTPKLPGAVSLDASMKTALSEKDYVKGISQMLMLGRDADAARLAKAILTQDPRALTPELARVMLPVFYQSGRSDLFTKCFLAIDQELRQEALTIDMAWKALGPELDSTRIDEILDAMTSIIRDATFIEDVSAVANATRRLRGESAAIAFLTRLERTEGISSDRKRFLQRQMDRIKPSRD